MYLYFKRFVKMGPPPENISKIIAKNSVTSTFLAFFFPAMISAVFIFDTVFWVNCWTHFMLCKLYKRKRKASVDYRIQNKCLKILFLVFFNTQVLYIYLIIYNKKALNLKKVWTEGPGEQKPTKMEETKFPTLIFIITNRVLRALYVYY